MMIFLGLVLFKLKFLERTHFIVSSGILSFFVIDNLSLCVCSKNFDLFNSK